MSEIQQDKRKIVKTLYELREEGTLELGEDFKGEVEGIDLNIQCTGSVPDPAEIRSILEDALDFPELYGYFGTAKIDNKKYYVFTIFKTGEKEPYRY